MHHSMWFSLYMPSAIPARHGCGASGGQVLATIPTSHISCVMGRSGWGEIILSKSVWSVALPITRRSDELGSSEVLVVYGIVFGAERIFYDNETKKRLDLCSSTRSI